MTDKDLCIDIKDLSVEYRTVDGVVSAINGVDLQIERGKTLGLVGETGAGKTTTALSILNLIPNPPGVITNGTIILEGKNIFEYTEKEMEEIRGSQVSMIFQDPMTSLNPVFTIGYQLDEVMFIHYPEMSKEDVKAHTIEMLNLVGISMPERVYKSYPHELSGGMRQRVMIAMALAGDPKLIIADEPTTALDVTIQAQILELLKDIQKKTGCAIMLITHDLGVIAAMADEVVVMYAGKIIEKGTVTEIFKHPKHPYTIGLQKSKPLITSNANEPLYSIPGQVPNPINLPNTCFFKNRCNKCIGKCNGEYPKEIKVSDTHYVSCYLYEEGEE